VPANLRHVRPPGFLSASSRADIVLIVQSCKLRKAPYSCPSCNVHYCSLDCFRSESHADCSEAFYRKSLLQDVDSRASGDAEKREMLEMLKRLEDEDPAGSDDDDDFDGLADKLDGVDLGPDSFPPCYLSISHTQKCLPADSIPSEQLLKMLSAREREDFLSHLQDPALATQLLGSVRMRKPWWERTFGSEEDDYEPKPDFVAEQDIPALPPAVKEKAPTLKWNFVAALLVLNQPLTQVNLF
jgi:hypothetical protein